MSILTKARRRPHTGRYVRRVCVESRAAPAREDLALIALAVVAQTAEDLRSDCSVHRTEARAFVASEDFQTWCEFAGLAPGRVRSTMIESVEP
jgi:hypothetical protein